MVEGPVVPATSHAQPRAVAGDRQAGHHYHVGQGQGADSQPLVGGFGNTRPARTQLAGGPGPVRLLGELGQQDLPAQLQESPNGDKGAGLLFSGGV